MSHTPTPWVFDYEATGGHIKSLGIPKPDGQDWKPTPTVCRYDDEMCLQPLIAHTISKDERRANAAFICEAVNNHDRLTAEVGRLREREAKLRELASGWQQEWAGGNWPDSCYDEAMAVTNCADELQSILGPEEPK